MASTSGNLISNFTWIERDWRPEHGRDIAFNEFLNVSEERREDLMQNLYPVLNSGRSRARKSGAAERLKCVLGCIVANAIVAMEHHQHRRVHYSRNERTYVGATPYKPDWLRSIQFIQTIDALRNAGLLKTTTAGRGSPRAGGFRSTFRAANALSERLAEMGVTADEAVESSASVPVLILRDDSGNLIPYSTEERADEIADLRAFNALLQESDIGVDLLIEGASQSLPLPRVARLHRVYNVSFDRGGRFYGGWWQGVPKDQRARITINGERTIERDFSGFLARAHYHAAGIEYSDDPYAVPKVRAAFEAQGVCWEAARPVVKAIFFLMLNAKGRRGLHGTAEMKRLPPGLSPREALDAIEEHHARIQGSFYSDSSFRLMAREARICSRVLKVATDARRAVLPVHDSFITCESDDDWLREAMIGAYSDEFGFHPVVM